MVFNRADLMDATGKILEENGIRYPYSLDLRAVWEASSPIEKNSAQAICCAAPLTTH
jgi:hypothetical protein